jgi:hypothetical protein
LQINKVKFILILEHELILKDIDKNQKMRNKLRAIMQIKTEKKNKEKEEIKKEVKVLKMLQEDFDPELYIKEQESENEENSNNSD